MKKTPCLIYFAAGLLSMHCLLSIPYLGEVLQEAGEESLICIILALMGWILFFRKSRVAVVLFCVGALLLQCSRILTWRFREEEISPSLHDRKIFNLGSLNVLHSNEPTQDAIDWISSQDVAVLLEFSSKWAEALKDLPGPRYVSDGYFGIAVISKTGCLDQEIGRVSIESMQTEKLAVWIRCTIPYQGQMLDIFALHPPAPIGILQIRERQSYIAEVLRTVKASSRHKIIAGDFNSAPWSRLMQQVYLETNMRSTYEVYPAKSTYPSARYFPFLFGIPIDHILFSKALRLLKFQRISSFGSDHFGLEASFQFVH